MANGSVIPDKPEDYFCDVSYVFGRGFRVHTYTYTYTRFKRCNNVHTGSDSSGTCACLGIENVREFPQEYRMLAHIQHAHTLAHWI